MFFINNPLKLIPGHKILGVYGAILEQNARFRPIYGSLRRSVMIDLEN